MPACYWECWTIRRITAHRRRCIYGRKGSRLRNINFELYFALIIVALRLVHAAPEKFLIVAYAPLCQAARDAFDQRTSRVFYGQVTGLVNTVRSGTYPETHNSNRTKTLQRTGFDVGPSIAACLSSRGDRLASALFNFQALECTLERNFRSARQRHRPPAWSESGIGSHRQVKRRALSR